MFPSNTHSTVVTQVKVSLLNFTITIKGLEEQLLNTAVKEELPDLAQKKVSYTYCRNLVVAVLLLFHEQNALLEHARVSELDQSKLFGICFGKRNARCWSETKKKVFPLVDIQPRPRNYRCNVCRHWANPPLVVGYSVPVCCLLLVASACLVTIMTAEPAEG